MPDKPQENPAGRPVHGSVGPTELRALGLKPEDLLDFSASISPIGPPDGVWEAIRSVDLSRYPDPECLDLRETICRHLSTSMRQIPIERVLVGNGSTEIFHLLTRVYLSNQHDQGTALLMTPTYGEYDGACRLANARILNCSANLSGDFAWDIPAAVALINDHKPDLVIICNPNNPTGVYLAREEIEFLADATRGSGGLLVVDEAYRAFVEDTWDSLTLLDRTNVMLVRSMTKDYAQTALRLGYALASEDVVSRLREFQPDWSVNSLAQKAGVFALEDTGYLPKAREAVFSAKRFLTDKLLKIDSLEVSHSHANFILVEVGDAAKWRSLLMAKGMVVRDCTSFGLPGYIRIGIRSMPDCQRLAAAMADVAASISRLGLDEKSPGT